MTIAVNCLKTVVVSGQRRYPLFVGFMTAADIAKVAEAPSFNKETTHSDIAVNVLQPPVKEWQRPLEKMRIGDIRLVFNDSGALMPNPVLLSENGQNQGTVHISQVSASGSIPTDIWRVEISGPSQAQKPLWILDGQHRIMGMAQSKQSENEIPVVLLLNDGAPGQSYNGRDFAKLFAQVTTTAKKLDDLHNAWLTYAYDLAEYSDSEDDAQLHRAAMQTVAELCRRPNLDDDQPNPFFSGIRFNPENPGGRKDGFNYGCNTLKDFVLQHYFAQPHTGEDLLPDELANEIAEALIALRSVVKAPQDQSVFFGSGEYGHVAMQDAFVIAVLERLCAGDPPNDWVQFLKGLNFDQTDWRFKAWAKTMGGKAGTDSRKLAARVMKAAFREGALPEGVSSIADYLKGNRAKVDFVFSLTNEAGRPIKKGHASVEVFSGDNVSHDTEGRLHVRIAKAWRYGNVARIEAVDASSSAANPKALPALLGAGLLLDPELPEAERTLEVALQMIFYGGISKSASLMIKW